MLDDFTRDKPHYQELRPQVVQEIVNIRQTSPTLPPDQTLRLAYHNVMDRTGYGKVIEQRREAERRAEEARQQKAKAAKARKSTSVNVKSGMTSTSAPKTMDDTLNAIGAKALRLLTMARGGFRPGAGRKKGQTSRYISEQIRKHAMTDGGLTPLEVMIGQMRYLWNKGGTDNRMKAVEVARPPRHTCTRACRP
jgi:hypothetical protein